MLGSPSLVDLDRDYCHWTVGFAAMLSVDFAGLMLVGSVDFAGSEGFSSSHSSCLEVCCPSSTSFFGSETIF